MAAVHNSSVNYHSFELIFEVLLWEDIFGFFIQVLLRILLQWQDGGKLAIVVEFDPLVNLEIVLESLQTNIQVIRQFLYRLPFQGFDFLSAYLAHVGILPFQHFPLDEEVQALLYVVFNI